MSYTDYTWYKDVYKGCTAGEEEFSSLAIKASAFLDRITFGRIDDADENVMFAMCAVVDEMLKSKNSSYIAAETNDGYSISYKGVDEKEKLYDAAKLFLPPELLYKGVEV